MTGFRTAAWVLLALLAPAALAHASPVVYTAVLNGLSESPPNASPGTGFATVTLDATAHTMEVNVTFANLLGTTTASHIHAATPTPFTGVAGVATQTPTFTGFPLGVTSGTYDHIFDTTLLSTYNSSFVTANGGTAASAESALFGDIANGTAYLNIHTTVVGAGEIRGFLTPVPLPGALPAGTLVLMGIGAWRMGRRRVAVRA